jgi:hypothetical protein
MTKYVGRPHPAVAEAGVHWTLLDTLPKVRSIEDGVMYYIHDVDLQVVVEVAAAAAYWLHALLGANLQLPNP